MTFDEMISVIAALKDGKKVLAKRLGESDLASITCGSEHQFNFRDLVYWIKPEPKVIYVNEWDSGVIICSHDRDRMISEAQKCPGGIAQAAVKYIEAQE